MLPITPLSWGVACCHRGHNELAKHGTRHHIGAMNRKALTNQVRSAIKAAPCSLRELAKEAGVPHSTLVRIRSRQREATPEVSRRLAKALRSWSTRCLKLANAIERAARNVSKEV